MTSSKVLAAQRSYHHGDLRAALLDEALRLLEDGDPAVLSLREIARNVGVSATAVYRHFPDKDSLLGALACEGLEMLAKRQRAVLARTRGKLAFAALGRAYVRFALAHPGLFRLMFTHHQHSVESLNDEPAGSAAWLLREQVALELGPNASDEQIAVTALRAWSLVHGFSMLILDRQIDRKTGEALIDTVVSIQSVGLG